MKEPFIRCDNCLTEYYEIIYEDTNQAYMCAAECTEYGVFGCYGSVVYDGNFGTWKNGVKPESVRTGVICDECILRLIEEGLLIEKEKDLFYGKISVEDTDFLINHLNDDF